MATYFTINKLYLCFYCHNNIIVCNTFYILNAVIAKLCFKCNMYHRHIPISFIINVSLAFHIA